MENQDCLLCAQKAQFIGLGQCNHQPICYKCIYKMRVISKSNSCPICKTACKQMIIIPEFQPFQNIKKEMIPDKVYGDIFFGNQQCQKAFQKLAQYRCFLKVNGVSCKYDKKFPSIAFLKKHLKQDHNRHICDICFEKKTCVLQQQKLYTFNQLDKHLKKGDIDDYGNVAFLHPFCNFCNQYFFDDDQFKLHLSHQHINCNVCGNQQKYRYYKNYNNLENHFKITHYICMEKDCLQKKFIAFKTANELKVHKMQAHQRSNKKIDIKQLCGFQSEGHNQNDQKVIFKDNQGIDMENQFLSLKKSKNRTLIEADKQQDEILDIRDFYNCGLHQNEHAERIFPKKATKQTERLKTDYNQEKNHNNHQTEKYEKKKKWVQKDQAKEKFQQKITMQQLPKQDQKLLLDDLLLVQSLHWTKLTNEEFDSQIKDAYSNDIIKKLGDLRRDLLKKKINSEQFVNEYFKLLKSTKFSFNIFPHYLRTVYSDDIKAEADYAYLKRLKQLPCRVQNSLIKKSTKYSDFFQRFLKQIQKNLENRIINEKLSIKKPITKDKARLFQIVGVVRRLKIHQMAKLKFSLNFGIHQETVDYLITKVFKLDIADFQRRIDKIQNQEFLDLYVFVKYCYQAIKHTQIMHVEKHKIHQNILEDFLYERPPIDSAYGLKKEELKTIEEKVQFEKQEEEKKTKKQLKVLQKKNQEIGFTNKANFSLQDKADFPELIIGKKSNEQKTDLKEIVSEAKSKPVTYQKKINEMFPILGIDANDNAEKNKNFQQYSELQKPFAKQSKQQKAWWEKINQKKKNIDEQQQPEVVKVRQGKNKKQKWVSVKMDGLFGGK